MNRSFLPFAIVGAFVLSAQGAAAQSLQPAVPTDIPIAIGITVPADAGKYGKAKKLHKKRLQFSIDSTSASLRLTGASKLPMNKVKLSTVRRPKPSDFISFNRDTMGGFIRAEQQKVWNTLLEMGVTTPKSKPTYEQGVNRFIAGKHAQRMSSQWHTLARVPMTAETSSVQAKLRTGLFRKAILTTDTLPGAEPYFLPAVDTDPCEPFDRFFERRKLRGYGIDKLHYIPYIRTQSKVIHKDFEVYFEKNRAQADLSEVAQFLKTNNLSIWHASMEGFSSVEGTAERNRQLQEQRARRMMYALQSFNKLPVQSDTIVFTDAWVPFREELRHSPHATLDTLDNETLRDRVNNDPAAIAYFEPYFRQHRKATLRLTLAGKLSDADVVKRLVSDFNHELNKVKAGDSPANRETEGKLLGMLEYFDRLYQAGQTDSMDVADLVDNSAWAAEARILAFYHEIKSFEERNTDDRFNWDSTFVSRKWNNSFSVAASNAIGQVEGCMTCRYTDVLSEKKKRLEQLVDVQYYTFKYIREGLLDPEVLCKIEYPKSPRYYGYKLNHLAMAHELSRERHFSCFGFGANDASPAVAKLRPDKASVDSLVAVVEASRGPSQPGPRSHTPTYNAGEKGAYYFFVKTLALQNGESIRKFVYTSDNYFEFDLYYLLRLNVSKWDPLANHFYDKDISLNRMRQLVSRLKSIDRHICPTDVNQLYLDFYLKSLQYLTNHRTPGDAPEMNLADQSMRGIASYYASRPRMLYPRLVLHVVKQLHTFYWLPTQKASIGYAFDVMGAADSRRLLSDEEQEIWNVYLKLYKPKYRSYRPREEREAVPKSIVSKTAVAGE